jgi:hypothetical protein
MLPACLLVIYGAGSVLYWRAEQWETSWASRIFLHCFFFVPSRSRCFSLLVTGGCIRLQRGAGCIAQHCRSFWSFSFFFLGDDFFFPSSSICVRLHATFSFLAFCVARQVAGLLILPWFWKFWGTVLVVGLLLFTSSVLECVSLWWEKSNWSCRSRISEACYSLSVNCIFSDQIVVR